MGRLGDAGRRGGWVAGCLLGGVLITMLWAPPEAWSTADSVRKLQLDRQRAELLKEGKRVYEKYCVGCHGEKGDGKGPAARFLDPKPRDFTLGVFKFRSTPSGSLPTDQDLHRTLMRGVLRTSMPAWVLVPEQEKIAVMEYIKTFAKDVWAESEPPRPLFIPEPPEYVGTPESTQRGKVVYEEMKCWECHGKEGKGDGPKAAELKDDWGNPIKPFDFTSGALKGGAGVKDIYRTFTTGLDGTPMPSFADSLSEEDRWHLVSYILSLRQGR